MTDSQTTGVEVKGQVSEVRKTPPPRPLSSGDESEKGSNNPVPLPPRRPLRPGTINSKPRERKYPLDTSDSDRVDRTQTMDSEGHSDRLSDQPSSATHSSSELNTTRESDDSVFDSENEQKRQQFPSLVNSSQFCVKNVRLNAEDLGINDNSDTFWSNSVNFEEFPEVNDGDTTPHQGGFRYKTSDNVSYEDLLEFALDTDE